MPRLNVEFEKTIYDQLTVLSAEEGHTISKVVRKLVLEWISEKWKEKARLTAVKSEPETDEVQDAG